MSRADLARLNRGVDVTTLVDDPATGIVMRRDMWEAATGRSAAPEREESSMDRLGRCERCGSAVGIVAAGDAARVERPLLPPEQVDLLRAVLAWQDFVERYGPPGGHVTTPEFELFEAACKIAPWARDILAGGG